MKVAGLTSTDYKREGQLLTILFTEGSEETFEQLDLSSIQVTTDNGLVVETFNGFTELLSIGKNIATGTYTVTCRIPTDAEDKVASLQTWSEAQVGLLQAANESLKTENTQLTAKLEASIKSNQMLEDCIVEMAEIVYA